MVDTIKFSEMPNAGNINNNDIMPSLRSGENVILNNPWTFLPPGDTASRPAPSATINYRLRFNTEDQLYEYYDAVLGAWTQLQESAFTIGPFITYTASSSLPDAQNLALLSNGILKQTITTGVATLNIAVNGTDYYGPGFVIPGTDGGTGVNNGALTIDLGGGASGYVMTSDSSGNATWLPVSSSGSITKIDGDTGSVTPLLGEVLITGASTGLTFTGVSQTLSLGGILNPASGGTGINNGSSTLTLGGNLTTSGAFASIFTMTADTNVTFPTSGTLATTSQLPSGAALTKTDDTNVTLTLGGSPTVALLAATSLTLGWTGELSVLRGGTGVSSVTISPTASAWAGWDANKNLSANNFLPGYTTTATAASTTTLTVASTYSQFFTGSTTQTVVLPVTSTLVLGFPFYIFNASSGNVTVQSSGANNIQVMAPGTSLYLTVINTGVTTASGWNAEYAFNGGSGSGTVNSGTINQLAWYAASGTAVSGLATANNGVLVTSNTGVPSISTTFGQGLALASSILSVGGSNNIPFADSHGIQDTNGNSFLVFGLSASAVNFLTINNAATGQTPSLNANGSDTNVILELHGKGTGGVAIHGTGTNDSATSGYVGEFFSSTIAFGSSINPTTATATDVTSLLLPAGDFDTWGNVVLSTPSNNLTFGGMWSSSTSATLPDQSLYTGFGSSITAAVNTISQSIPYKRYSFASPTTIYLSCYVVFASGTVSACGSIYARRVR